MLVMMVMIVETLWITPGPALATPIVVTETIIVTATSAITATIIDLYSIAYS